MQMVSTQTVLFLEWKYYSAYFTFGSWTWQTVLKAQWIVIIKYYEQV